MFGRNKITKQHLSDGTYLRVVKGSPWLTIQGEGPNVGRPAVFVRLHGCPLRCTFCDTNFDDEDNPVVHVETLAEQVGSFQKDLCVITGGEPLLQNFVPLAGMLFREYGMDTQIETAGTLWVEGAERFEIICSPKTPTIHPLILEHASAFKYVISAKNEHDKFIPITATQPGARPQRLASPREFTDVYLSPMDEYDVTQNEYNMQLVAYLALRYNCIAGCQLHKVLKIKEPS